MKIVIIGGTGLIGKKMIQILGERGHEAIAASPSTGVDAHAGTGLSEALAGADVVVDVTNPKSFDPDVAREFFERSTRNLLAAESAAGVGHHLALSVVGADRFPERGYLQAKVAQERVIEAGGVPYTIARATQFYEFLGAVAASGEDGGAIRLPASPMQPLAADDVAILMADLAEEPPANGRVELAGPELGTIAGFVARFLAAAGDPRTVTPDPAARYFGVDTGELGLAPGEGARLAPARFDDWARKAGLSA